jgi:hypothetical protein
MSETDVARARRNAWIALLLGITVAYWIGFGAGRLVEPGLPRELAQVLVYAVGTAVACRTFWVVSRPLEGRGQRAHPIAVMAIIVAISGDRMAELGIAGWPATLGSMLMTTVGVAVAMAIYWKLDALDMSAARRPIGPDTGSMS